jgi:hypothetical protein
MYCYSSGSLYDSHSGAGQTQSDGRQIDIAAACVNWECLYSAV